MPGSVGDRLKQARTSAGYGTMIDAVRAHGWNANTYRSHENGTRGVPREWLVSYSVAFRCSLTWLITGREEGGRRSVSGADDPHQSVPVVSWEALPAERGRIVGYLESERLKAKRHLRFDPPVGGKEVVALTVRDTSMVHPTDGSVSIYPGDDLVVDVGARPRPGQIALIFDPVAREHHLRRATFPTRTLARFVAANQDHPPIELPADSPHILGVAVAMQRRL